MTRYISAAGLVACLVYLWVHASPGGRDLLAGIGATGCTIVLGAIAIRRAR